MLSSYIILHCLLTVSALLINYNEFCFSLQWKQYHVHDRKILIMTVGLDAFLSHAYSISTRWSAAMYYSTSLQFCFQGASVRQPSSDWEKSSDTDSGNRLHRGRDGGEHTGTVRGEEKRTGHDSTVAQPDGSTMKRGERRDEKIS